MTAYPFLSAYKSDLKALNRFVFDGALRRYQQHLLGGDLWSVASPLTGRPLALTGSIDVGRNALWFRCQSDDGVSETLWVHAGGIAKGYALGLAFLEADGGVSELFLPDGKAPAERVAKVAKADLARAAARRRPRPVGALRPVLEIGHPNFAHLAWNELSGLQAYITATGPDRRPLPYRETHAPLGPIAPLVSDADWLISADAGEPSGTEDLRFRVGSIRLGAPTQTRILDHARARRTERTEAIRRRVAGRPVLWCSVRTINRSAGNQTVFLAELAARAAALGAVVMLDGFSMPEGQTSAGKAALVADNIDRVAAALDAVQRLAVEAGADPDALIDINGVSLLEALDLGDLASFYVCHAGTLQHKLAWFRPVPGVVLEHLNPEQTTDWYHRCVEGSILPHWLPTSHFAALPLPHGVLPRNGAYDFVDPGASAQACIDLFEAALRDHVTSPHEGRRPNDENPA